MYYDHLGSVVARTSGRGTSLQVERVRYSPFGEQKDPNNWSGAPLPQQEDHQIGYTGHEDEGSFGLINMGGRIYEPAVGRFLTPDPLVSAADFSQDFNRYSYAWNAPLIVTDPSGLAEKPGSSSGGSSITIGIVGVGGHFILPSAVQSGDTYKIFWITDEKGMEFKGTASGADIIRSTMGNTLDHVTKKMIDEGKLPDPDNFRNMSFAVMAAPFVMIGGAVGGVALYTTAGDAMILFPRAANLAADIMVSLEEGYIGYAGLGMATTKAAASTPIAKEAASEASSRLVRIGRAMDEGFVWAKDALRRLFKQPIECFVAGTLVLTPGSSIAIENLRVGDRVSTYQGVSVTSVDSTWSVVSLEVIDEASGTTYQVEALRPSAWVAANKITGVGSIIQVDLSELSLHGLGVVTGFSPVGSVAPGEGRIVLTTVSHLNDDVYELSFEGGEELRLTGGHPLYSLKRNRWVETSLLAAGEPVQTLEGQAVVSAVERFSGSHWVYNIEVEGDHEYLVGKESVRTHNICFPRSTLRGVSLRWLGRNKPNGWRRVSAKGNGWVWLDENNVERLRFMRPSGANPANFFKSRMTNGYFKWKNAAGELLDIDGQVVPEPLRPPKGASQAAMEAYEVAKDVYQRAAHIMYEGP